MTADDKAWLDYRERFSSVYDESNYSSTLQSFVMNASHKLVERPFTSHTSFDRVLEVGAGTGEHVKFIQHCFKEYFVTDNDEATLDVAKNKIDSSSKRNIIFQIQSANELTYLDNTFDRLVATHVLEHIYYPHLALKEWSRVTKDGGILSILIPTDPGLAWRLGRHLGPRKTAISLGIAYDYVMAREHVNSCNNLIAILRHYFPGSKEAWWPFPLPSIDLNLFYAFHAVIKKTA